MKFLVLMYSDPAETKALNDSEIAELRARHKGLHAEESGVFVNGAGMLYPSETTTIRLSADGPVSSDGPFMVGREQLTAYYVVECTNRAEAVSVAVRLLDFHTTAVEVRQIHESYGM